MGVIETYITLHKVILMHGYFEACICMQKELEKRVVKQAGDCAMYGGAGGGRGLVVVCCMVVWVVGDGWWLCAAWWCG